MMFVTVYVAGWIYIAGWAYTTCEVTANVGDLPLPARVFAGAFWPLGAIGYFFWGGVLLGARSIGPLAALCRSRTRATNAIPNARALRRRRR